MERISQIPTTAKNPTGEVRMALLWDIIRYGSVFDVFPNVENAPSNESIMEEASRLATEGNIRRVAALSWQMLKGDVGKNNVGNVVVFMQTAFEASAKGFSTAGARLNDESGFRWLRDAGRAADYEVRGEQDTRRAKRWEQLRQQISS